MLDCFSPHFSNTWKEQMSQIQELLEVIGKYHRTVLKALSAQRDRTIWIIESKDQASSVRQLLADNTLANELDSLLDTLHQELSDRRTALHAASVVSGNLAAFVKAEANLHRLTHVRPKVYVEMVDEVRPWIKASLRPDFPQSSAQFLIEFERLHEEFLKVMESAPNLPRRDSKESKSEFGWKLWRYSLGTLITLANMYVTYHQPSFQGMGSVSVSVGAWYFGRRNGGPKKPPSSGSASNTEEAGISM
jgi:hypothetical protein